MMNEQNQVTKNAASKRNGIGRRDLEKESFWRRTMREQSATGKSVRKFCREHELSEASFHHWRRELRLRALEKNRLTPDASATASAFAEVHMTEENPSLFEIEIARGDLSIRLRGRYDPALLREAVALLGDGSC